MRLGIPLRPSTRALLQLQLSLRLVPSTPQQQRIPVAAWLGGMPTGARRGVCAQWCRRATVVEGTKVRCIIGGREAGMAGIAWEERLAVACVQGGGEMMGNVVI